MSSATMELAEPSPTAAPRFSRKSNEAVMRLFEVSGRIIEWMQSRRDRVVEAYLTAGYYEGWNLYVKGKSIAYDFDLGRELSEFVIAWFDQEREYLDARLISFSNPEEMMVFFNPSHALRLTPG